MGLEGKFKGLEFAICYLQFGVFSLGLKVYYTV